MHNHLAVSFQSELLDTDLHIAEKIYLHIGVYARLPSCYEFMLVFYSFKISILSRDIL